MINNHIKVSKQHVIRKKKDCTFRWHPLHALRFWQFFKISNYSWVAFIFQAPCIAEIMKQLIQNLTLLLLADFLLTSYRGRFSPPPSFLGNYKGYNNKTYFYCCLGGTDVGLTIQGSCVRYGHWPHLRIASLGKVLTQIVPLSTQEYKWVPGP